MNLNRSAEVLAFLFTDLVGFSDTGAVVVSAAVATRTPCQEDVSFRALGVQLLKGISEPVEALQVLRAQRRRSASGQISIKATRDD